MAEQYAWHATHAARLAVAVKCILCKHTMPCDELVSVTAPTPDVYAYMLSSKDHVH
jgi:hypothetical protein